MSALMVLVVMLGQAPTKVEVTLFPAAVQLNGMFTQTAGTFGTVSLRIREGVSLQVFGGGNWHFQETALTKSLLKVGRAEPTIGQQLWWTWGLFAGAEIEPITGTLSVFGTEVKFGWTMGAGLGGGGTSIAQPRSSQFSEIDPVTGAKRANTSWRDTGARFMGTVSTGLRIVIAKYFVLRTEIRDVMFGSHISSVDGCPLTTQGSEYVGSCGLVISRSPSIPGSQSLLERQQNEVIVNIGAYVGAGVVF